MSSPAAHFRWILKDTLDALGITRYALQKEAGVAMNTVRAMYDGTTTRADFEVIQKVVQALSKLSGRHMTASDILVWQEIEQSS